jgi:hypothetical protein
VLRRFLFRKRDPKASVAPHHFLDVDDWKKPKSALRPLFLFNLIGLITLGTLGSAWILYFTPWFPKVGGLLALGGLFSWLAFVFRLVPSDTGTELQKRFASVLNSVLALGAIVLIGAGLWQWTAPYGAIHIETHQPVPPREAWIYAGKPGEPVGLAADGESTVLIKTALRYPESEPWHLKITGFPAILVPVTPRQRLSIGFPQAFRRRLMLIAPSADLIKDKAEMPSAREVTLQVNVRASERTAPVVSLTIENYGWFPFWVGCGADVLPDDSVRAKLNAVSQEVSAERQIPFGRPPESRPGWYCKECSGWEATENELPERGIVELIMNRKNKPVGKQVEPIVLPRADSVQVVLLSDKSFQKL